MTASKQLKNGSKKRGGARFGTGPKTASGEPMRRRNVMLSDADYACAVALGNGNASAGIRRALHLA